MAFVFFMGFLVVGLLVMSGVTLVLRGNERERETRRQRLLARDDTPRALEWEREGQERDEEEERRGARAERAARLERLATRRAEAPEREQLARRERHGVITRAWCAYDRSLLINSSVEEPFHLRVTWSRRDLALLHAEYYPLEPPDDPNHDEEVLSLVLIRTGEVRAPRGARYGWKKRGLPFLGARFDKGNGLEFGTLRLGEEGASPSILAVISREAMPYVSRIEENGGADLVGLSLAAEGSFLVWSLGARSSFVSSTLAPLAQESVEILEVMRDEVFVARSPEGLARHLVESGAPQAAEVVASVLDTSGEERASETIVSLALSSSDPKVRAAAIERRPEIFVRLVDESEASLLVLLLQTWDAHEWGIVERILPSISTPSLTKAWHEATAPAPHGRTSIWRVVASRLAPSTQEALWRALVGVAPEMHEEKDRASFLREARQWHLLFDQMIEHIAPDASDWIRVDYWGKTELDPTLIPRLTTLALALDLEAAHRSRLLLLAYGVWLENPSWMEADKVAAPLVHHATPEALHVLAQWRKEMRKRAAVDKPLAYFGAEIDLVMEVITERLGTSGALSVAATDSLRGGLERVEASGGIEMIGEEREEP